MKSPDGAFELVVTRDSSSNGGIGGMGHDADDYSQNDLTALVKEVATGRVVASQTWTSHYNANDQSSSGELPAQVVFAADGRAAIARFSSGREERLEWPAV